MESFHRAQEQIPASLVMTTPLDGILFNFKMPLIWGSASRPGCPLQVTFPLQLLHPLPRNSNLIRSLSISLFFGSHT